MSQGAGLGEGRVAGVIVLAAAPGERMVAASPDRAAMLAGGFTLVAGLLAAGVFADHNAEALWQAVCTSVGLATGTASAETGIDFTSVAFLANLFVTVTYGMVGWCLADCQVRRYLANGVWSLSGAALAGVFFTCAQMHLIDATARGEGLMLFFDLIGIPASIARVTRTLKSTFSDITNT